MAGLTLNKALTHLKHRHLLIKFLSAPVKATKKAKKGGKQPRPTESECSSTIANHFDEVFVLSVEGELIQACAGQTSSKHFTEALNQLKSF
jgi:hypothetical protein